MNALAWPNLGVQVAIATAAILAGIAVHSVIFAILARRTRSTLDDSFQRTFRAPLRIIFPLRALGVALTTFGGAKAIGAGMLAFTGLAGVPIPLIEPIRIEDVVIVENEWGWVEEMTTTYVVVRMWDLRRLVLPLAYFINNAFQNWTRRTANLLGYVYLYSDYTIRIRALTSAAESGLQFDLRCEVREKLLEFVQRKYPQFLPRMRGELRADGGRDPASNGDPRRFPPERSKAVAVEGAA